MLKKFLQLILSFGIMAPAIANCFGSSQGQPRELKENQCVECHSRITSPPALGDRYLDWHFSPHARAGIGCDKCHGGDSSSRDLGRAHKGVLPVAQEASRLSRLNLPHTCGSCHNAIVNSFVESTHYDRLKSTGLGPTCNTCHHHMASTVATDPSEASALCAYCHNTINGLQPQRPDIPLRARRVVESIGRANYLVMLVDELLARAKKSKIGAADETEDSRLLHNLLIETKVSWHAFNLDGVKLKADKAFAEGTRLRDQLKKKLDQK